MFCSKCGNEIVGNIKSCSKCGQAIYVSSDNYRTFTLTINRVKQWFVINPAIKITIDGSKEYKIDNGATLNIPVSVGTHNIAFSCSIRNKIININITNNVVLNIKWDRITGSIKVE